MGRIEPQSRELDFRPTKTPKSFFADYLAKHYSWR